MKWICPRCKLRIGDTEARCPKDGAKLRFGDNSVRCPTTGRYAVPDLSGLTLADRYTLRELIGIGGMGSTVWEGWQKSTERIVAIKVLPPANEAAAGRFARGARIASNLNHPHITVVHDYGKTKDDQLFLVMELLDGRTLHRELRGTRGLPIDRSLYVIDQVLRALEHAHEQRVVHRDLKPGNLFLVRKNDDHDYMKVLDFGISKYIIEEPDEGIESTDAGTGPGAMEVTQEQLICGTPHYMAPEQVGMGRIDARTDLYSLGVVAFRTLAGRLPFEGKSHHELFRKHLTEPPPRLSDVRPDLHLPDDLERFIARSLAKPPEERFQNASEMRSALRVIRRTMGLLGGDPDESMSSMSMSFASTYNGASDPGPSTPTPTPTPSLAMSYTDSGTGDVRPPSRARRGRGLMAAVLIAVLGVATAWLVLERRNGDDATAGSSAVASKPAPARSEAAATQASGDPSKTAAAVVPAPAEPPSERPAGPALAKAHIETTPAGARVRWNGELLGRTPLEFRLPVGIHTVEVSLSNYRDERVRLDMATARDGGVLHKVITLESEAPPPAEVAAAATPPIPAEPATPAAEVNTPARDRPTGRAEKKRASSTRKRGAEPNRPSPTNKAVKATKAVRTARVEPAPVSERRGGIRVQLLGDDETVVRQAPKAPSGTAPSLGNDHIELLDDDADDSSKRRKRAAAPPPKPGPKIKVDLID